MLASDCISKWWATWMKGISLHVQNTQLMSYFQGSGIHLLGRLLFNKNTEAFLWHLLAQPAT